MDFAKYLCMLIAEGRGDEFLYHMCDMSFSCFQNYRRYEFFRLISNQIYDQRRYSIRLLTVMFRGTPCTYQELYPN